MNTFFTKKMFPTSLICATLFLGSFTLFEFSETAHANTNTEVLENQDYRDLLKRADADDADALYQLADMFYYGESIPQNIERAFDYAQRSARKNFPQAYRMLGDLYMQSDPATGRPNPQKAIESYNKAISLKDDYSLFRLATIYYEGDGVPRDLNKAYSFYTKSANTGNVGAKHKIMEMTYKGEGVAKNPSKVFPYYLSRAKNNDMYAQTIVAKMYLAGEGTARNVEKAKEYFRRAASKRHTEAQYLYAQLLFEGKENPIESYAYARLAAEFEPTDENKNLVKEIERSISSSNKRDGRKLYDELYKQMIKR